MSSILKVSMSECSVINRAREQHAECVAHAQRCRVLAETVQSHSSRQMLSGGVKKHGAAPVMLIQSFTD
jgi:hypothetical protein